MSEVVKQACGTQVTIMSGRTTTGAGATTYKGTTYAVFQAIVTGTGAVTATIKIEASMDGTTWCDTALGTITLSGTTTDSDGFTTSSPWKFIRANVTAITGTGAAVTAYMGN